MKNELFDLGFDVNPHKVLSFKINLQTNERFRTLFMQNPKEVLDKYSFKLPEINPNDIILPPLIKERIRVYNKFVGNTDSVAAATEIVVTAVAIVVVAVIVFQIVASNLYIVVPV